MLEEVTQVDRSYDDADEAGDDADTGEVVLLFPDVQGPAAAELRARLADLQAENQTLRDLQAENQALRDQVGELEEFNREAALARERMFMRMRRELGRRQQTIESLERARAAAAGQTDEAERRIAECEALLDERATELERAAAHIAELEGEISARDNHAAISEAYRAELEAELGGLRREREELVEHLGERDEALAAAELAHRDALAELERRHRSELRQLHERAVRALTLQWLGLATTG